MNRIAAINTVLVILSIVIAFVGCYAQPSDTDDQSAAETGEPLEGPMYEPSGLGANPARPQSARPEPPPGP